MESSAADTSHRKIIFLASALGLFLELALIRWVSCEVRIFAYFKNMVLIACFLGFGIGCLMYRRPVHLLTSLLLLLLLCLLIQLPWQPLIDYGPRRISLILAGLPGLMIFKNYDAFLTWSGIAGILFALAWAVLVFVVLTLVIIPLGQITASSMSKAEGHPIAAYSINVAGSLTGILFYTFVTTIELPPICWFVPAALLFLYLPHAEPVRKEILAIVVGLTLVMLPNNTAKETSYWSPYQKLAVTNGERVLVNNIGYQTMIARPSLIKEKNVPINRTLLPFALRLPAGKVLIVGAGTGNDVAAAIGAGASSITAVEIDPVIVDIGRRLHPQKPYDDPRVTVIIDDARHFLRTTNDTFDLIVFSVLDSHTVLSSFTNVRLDDYIYTVESLKDARKRLRNKGILNLSFWIEQPYIAARLSRNLTEAFGHEPVNVMWPQQNEEGWRTASFFAAEKELMAPLEQSLSRFPLLRRFSTKNTDVVPSTDDWPFLPLSEPHIPILVLLLSLVVVVLCTLFIRSARPRGEFFQARVFWLGAAFMLLEVHNVSRLALCFGTTWKVNAWVIGMILSVILLANWISMRYLKETSFSARWVIVGLFASLLVAYLIPIQEFLAYSQLLGGFAATLLLTIPIFFAAILFANAFRNSASPAFALGWNILGAVVGGMTESISYLLGIPSLVLVAAVFYALALIWPQRVSSKEQVVQMA